MKKNLLGKILFSESSETINAWTGMEGYYKLLWMLEIFGFRFILWRKNK